MGEHFYFENYTPAADLTLIAVCIAMLILVNISFVTKTKNYSIFLSIVFLLIFAAACDVMQHTHFNHITDGDYTTVYILRILYHSLLFSIFLFLVLYICELQRLELDKKLPSMMIAIVIFVVAVSADIITTVRGTGFKIEKDGNIVSKSDVFFYGYFSFIILCAFLMIIFRSRLYKMVMRGFYGTVGVSFAIMAIQGSFKQSSFTAFSFLFPVLGMMYLVHSNPYDVELGAINAKALEDMVSYNFERKRELLFMSLYLPDFDMEGATFPKEMQNTIRRFAGEFFKNGVLFQITNGHIILLARKDKNPDHENRVNKILNAFDVEYEKFQFDYKIVMGESIEEISRKNEYISFISSIHRHMNMNEIHMVEYEDVTNFNRYEYILKELGDIYRRSDLRDTRILAYCQPVYNIKTKKYDTAEALMRLHLPEIGLVYPDQFIPLAEENGYIHVLTEIILQKTCDEIKYLLKENYEVNRISINVSVLEMKDERFTEDISNIIKESGIPEDKVAIEITETQSESDFMVMKQKIDELKEKGIKIYLDDFGTGYSNMERIMGLPFDIIKFDRSLVLASDNNERSEKMVGSLASMFADLDYSVLYECVENDGDEQRCINMSASYLQGYKYSRPIPIIELKNFFSKKGE